MNVSQMLMARGRTSRPAVEAVPALPSVAGRAYAVSINDDVLQAYSGPADPMRAASALRAIPSNTGRDEWLRATYAACAAGVGVEDYLGWCRTGGDAFTGNEDALKAWNSFDPHRANGITAGTLFHTARMRGWVEPQSADPSTRPANDAHASGAQADSFAQPTDLWFAGYFKMQRGDRFRYDHSVKNWRTYTGGSWALCRKGEQVEAMKGLAGLLMQEYGKLLVANPNGRDLKKLLACIQRAQSVQGIEAALKLAQSDPALAISAEELDTDPDLFNAANGVVHLPTGALRHHDPALMLFRQSPVAYDPAAPCPLFLQFMDEASCGDPKWVEFMQRELGYTLSGRVSEEKLFFWLGKGANGKSVLANILRHIFGTYAVTVPPAFMMQNRRDGGGATPELAMLAGSRLALANEIEAGSRLSAQTVKVAVSTEHITARHLYGAPFTFAPTHKLLIRGNHRPIVTDDDEGIWRRIVLIPFELDVPTHARDPGLEARLLTEAPGILRWMVEGFTKWQRDGLMIPKRVADASRAYRRESDLFMQWVADQCETGPPAFTVAQKRAYSSYRFWCSEQGLRQFSKASFTRGLLERGFAEGREGGGMRQHLYTGLKLRM